VTAAEIDALDANDEYYADLGSNIWLMDNHKWALYIWHRFRVASGLPQFSLLHADYHWDGGSDFYGSEENEQKILNADEAGLQQLIQEENLIRYDSFIAPAVLRGYLSEVHFFCRQDEYDIGIDEDLLARTQTTQVIHDSVEALAAQEFSSPLIYDLCLDLFNKSKMYYGSDIWPDEEIVDFLDACKHIVAKAELVTVSLSFGYSGTKADTRRLTKLVLPKLEEWRQ
jgi:hypothetical protein